MNHTSWYLGVLLLLATTKTALSIRCYHCSSSDSSKPFQCNEYLDDYDIEPESCDDVYGAKYCVKHTGRYDALLIKCYQCSAANTIYCSSGLIHSGGIQPENCSHVYDAKYCIVSYSLHGGIGAERFCSSLDLGTYCNFVKNPGDQLEYRSCVYTCTGDGCNSGTFVRPSFILVGLLTFFAVFMLCRR